MTDLELKNLWQAAHQKLEESLAQNRENYVDITRIKVKSFLSSMTPLKVFTLLIGLAWVAVGGLALGHVYIHAFATANKFFLYSATFQVAVTGVAVFIYMYQLALIHRVETFGPIWQTQRLLASLRTSTLWSARILFLQLPVWTTFWWNETMWHEWQPWQWAITLSITFSFIFIAVWIFVNVRYENRSKKWFRIIFSGREWMPLVKSMELLDQLESEPHNKQMHE